jgi:hypothetical protein
MQDVVRAPPGLKPACLEDVEGFASASPRQSLTTPAGTLRVAPIDGVRYRLARPVSHHHGHLTETFRADWGLTDAAGDDRQHAEPTLRPQWPRSLGAAVGLRRRPKNHPVPMVTTLGSRLSSGHGASVVLALCL